MCLFIFFINKRFWKKPRVFVVCKVIWCVIIVCSRVSARLISASVTTKLKLQTRGKLHHTFKPYKFTYKKHWKYSFIVNFELIFFSFCTIDISWNRLQPPFRLNPSCKESCWRWHRRSLSRILSWILLLINLILSLEWFEEPWSGVLLYVLNLLS
jgi:hypothetical protein